MHEARATPSDLIAAPDTAQPAVGRETVRRPRARAMASVHGLPADVADALERARVACDALGDADALHPHVRCFIAAAEQLLRAASRKKPPLPDRHTYLNDVAARNPVRPARAAAYDAMDDILAVGWPKLTNAEKQVRKRQKQRHEAALANDALPDYSMAALAQPALQPPPLALPGDVQPPPLAQHDDAPALPLASGA